MSSADNPVQQSLNLTLAQDTPVARTATEESRPALTTEPLLAQEDGTTMNKGHNIPDTPQLQTTPHNPYLAAATARKNNAPFLTPAGINSRIDTHHSLMSQTHAHNEAQSTKTMKNPSRKLDKDIKLKNKNIRSHVHRYDLNIKIKKKPKSDDEEEALIKSALQWFHKIMLAADNTSIIPPYLEMDRNDRTLPDITQDYQVSSIDDFTLLNSYFSRLSSRNKATGKVYCSVILAQSVPFASIINSSLNALARDYIGLYQRASDHEVPGEIGWLCYSL